MRSLTPEDFYPIDRVEESQIKFAVIAARYENKWILCRHKDRTTWEMPGGHRESGETPLETAKRELYEETGVMDAEIQIVGVYKLYDFGLLAFAQVNAMQPIPVGSEIAEIQLFEFLPENLTYGGVHDTLHQWVQGWLNMQTGAGELWDVYDENRNPTGRIHRRGDFLSPGDYHLVVHIWLQNPDGRLLLTKRSPNKGFPNMWECTGGSALAGDDSMTAAVREVREETGICLKPENGQLLMSMLREDNFDDIWLFRQEFDLSQVRLLEGETCGAMLATMDEIRQLKAQGTLVPYAYLEDILHAIENAGGNTTC